MSETSQRRQGTGVRPRFAVIGALSHVSGLGHVAHDIADSIGHWGYPVVKIDEGRLAMRPDSAAIEQIKEADIILFVLMPYGVDLAMRSMGPHVLRDKHVVANWWWEATPWPDDPRPFQMVHAVWTGSPFVTEAISQSTTKPVRTLPLSWAPIGTRTKHQKDVPLFVSIFDFRSLMERKNPEGAVKAYIEAFPEPGQAMMLIKTQHASERPVQARLLRSAIEGRADIEWIDAQWHDDRMEQLFDDMDVMVSLHRGEALGLAIVAAMRRGKPVLATDFGGAAWLMTKNDWPIRYTPTLVGPGHEPFQPDATWATPDHEAAVAAYQSAAARIREGVLLQPRRVALCHGDDAASFAAMVDELLQQRGEVRPSIGSPRLVAKALLDRLGLLETARKVLGLLRRLRR